MPETHPTPVVGVEAAESDNDLLSLAAQLCFALYATSRAMTAAYRPFLDAMEVTYPQYLTLLALWEQPGMTMKELGERLRLDYGTVSPLIQRLQARGLVESVRSATDRRAVELRATEAGRALQDRARRMVESVLDDVDWPVDTVATLRDQVHALGARLEHAGGRAERSTAGRGESSTARRGEPSTAGRGEDAAGRPDATRDRREGAAGRTEDTGGREGPRERSESSGGRQDPPRWERSATVGQPGGLPPLPVTPVPPGAAPAPDSTAPPPDSMR